MIYEHDIVVIGGGMAGAAIAVHLSRHASVRLLEARNGTIATNATVIALEHEQDAWAVSMAQDTVRAKIVINAAGAWAGEIGKLAGAMDVGLQPMKRTVCLIDPPAGQSADEW